MGSTVSPKSLCPSSDLKISDGTVCGDRVFTEVIKVNGVTRVTPIRVTGVKEMGTQTHRGQPHEDRERGRRPRARDRGPGGGRAARTRAWGSRPQTVHNEFLSLKPPAAVLLP